MGLSHAIATVDEWYKHTSSAITTNFIGVSHESEYFNRMCNVYKSSHYPAREIGRVSSKSLFNLGKAVNSQFKELSCLHPAFVCVGN